MLHASTQKLIIKLCELTALGDIQWREGRNGAVMLETEGYVVEVEGQPTKVRVLNSDGAELEHADAAQLAAAWPDGEGSFADHVATMALQAHRLARGTDQAIARILSSLSAPPAAKPARTPEPEIRQDDLPPVESGAESEATMAAAVGDMAIRLNRTPLESASDTPPAADHFKRSTEMFGRTRSFAVAGRTHHRPSPEARPVSSLGKITASGLVMPNTLFGSRTQTEIHAAEESADQTPAPAPEEATPGAPRPSPTPASPDAYKPWL